MAVSNTVQGLNNVVDLLKNILDTLKDDQKAVQPKDVSSTSKVTANKKSNDANLSKSVDDINAISKLEKNTTEKAGSFVNIIRTITSKSVINGIMKFGMLKMTGMFKAFSTGVKLLVEAINQINEINVTNKKLKSFMTVSNTINNTAKTFIKSLYALAGFVVVAAGIGLLAQFAWPQILIGFGVIVAIITGLALITGLIFTLTKFIFKNNTGAELNVPQFAQMAQLFLYLSGIVVVAAAVGLLAQFAWPQILIGFLAIAGIMILLSGIMLLTNKLGENFKDSAIGLAWVVGCLYALALLVVISYGLGLLIREHWKEILIGFGMIIFMIACVSLIILGLAAISNIIKNTDAFNSIRLTLIVIAGVMLVSALTVLLITKTAEKIKELGGSQRVWEVIGMIGAILLGISAIVGVLIFVASLKGIGTTAIVVVAALLFSIGYVINAIGNTINSIVDVLLKIDEYKKNHENRDPFEGAGMIGLKIGWFVSTLSVALVPAALAVGLIGGKINKIKKLVDMVSDFVNIISKFAGDGNSLRPILGYNDDGTPKLGQPINMQNVAKVISSSFSIFVNILGETIGKLSQKSARTVKKYGKALNKIMDPVASFIEIATKENEKLNNADLISKAKNIASIMTAFTTEISRGMLEADNAARNSIGQQLKNLFTSGSLEIFTNRARRTRKWAETGSAALDMIGNLGNLFDLLTMYTISPDGKYLTYKKENGEEVVEKLDFTGYSALFKNIVSSIEPINKEKITNIENLGTAFEDFENIIIKNQEKNIKAIKEYTAAIKEMSLEFKNAANAIKDVNKLDMPEFKSSSATSKSSTSSAATASQTTAVASTPQQTNSISGSDIVDAIKEGLNGAILNVSFSDSVEEFTAELGIS